MIALPFSANFKQKLLDMKHFGVAYLVNINRLSSLLEKNIINKSINLIKEEIQIWNTSILIFNNMFCKKTIGF